MNSKSSIERLLRLRGIEKNYRDYQGQMREVSGESLHRVLESMGHSVTDPQAIERDAQTLAEKEWRRVLPAAIVYRADSQDGIEMTFPSPLPARLSWRFQTENGAAQSGELIPGDLPIVGEYHIDGSNFCRLAFRLPFDTEPGYHDLIFARSDGSLVATTKLIVVPQCCWEPAEISEGANIWGLALQLYSLRSEKNWGIGDFRDLEDLMVVAAMRGIDMIGLSPLHALFPARPESHSPYSPASRLFLNVLYIAPESVPEFEQSRAAQTLLASTEFRADLERLRACEWVDYEGVGRCKDTVLRLLFSQFEKDPSSLRQEEFTSYIKKSNQNLENIALYYALDCQEVAAGRNGGWRSWRVEYQEPASEAVRKFKENHVDEVRYHMYLQWTASQQLMAVEEAAKNSGMRIGLYRDLAVGVNEGGADTWMDQAIYVGGVTIGAPPDALAPQGQDWCMPPMNPDNLRDRGYQPFIDLLRENMSSGGALRIDHVMALRRLWWVPEGMNSTAGAYVRNNLDDLIGIVALESQRCRCLVIGEDLGTVPQIVRTAMQKAGMYSYKVLVYEADSAGCCRNPEDYPRRSVVTITTHDLPPLAGFWSAADIRARQSLGLYADEESLHKAVQIRAHQKTQILDALCRQGLLETSSVQHEKQLATLTPEIANAIQTFVARCGASLMIVRPEDWLEIEAPFNLPGTDREYQNWRKKLTVNLVKLLADKEYADLCARLSMERRREVATSS